MELRYDLTANDYRALTRHETRKLRRTRMPWHGYVLGVALGLLTALLLVTTRPDKRVLNDALLLIGFILASWGARLYITRLKTRAYLQSRYQGGPSAITVSVSLIPEGIKSQTSLGSAVTFWHALRDIEHGDQHVFMKEGIASVHIIPKRAFRDEQHMRAFLDEVNAHRAASAAAQASPPMQ